MVGLTDAHVQDPSQILSDTAASQNIVSTKVFVTTTNITAPTAAQSPNPGVPHEGGGISDIAFLAGSASGPNANAAQMTATFWVEEIIGPDYRKFLQLRYIQRVLLNFGGLTWPHISLATMVVTAES